MRKIIPFVLSGILIVTLLVIFGIKNSKSSTENTYTEITIFDSASSVIYTPTYEELLCGCVEGLLPFPAEELDSEALKAVAITMNTRLKHLLGLKRGALYGADLSVCRDIPYSPEEPSEAVKSAVKEVIGQTLFHNGEFFNAPICLCSTGRTDEYPPYSPSVGLPCDSDSSMASSVTEFTPEQIHAALGKRNITSNYNEWFSDAVYGSNESLIYINFCGEHVTGKTLYDKLNLKSTAITIEYFGDVFTIKCRGRGENRGLSVNAADYLARHGKTAEEILKIFFPECKIK